MKVIKALLGRWYYYSFSILLCMYVASTYRLGGTVEGYSMYPTLDSGMRVSLSKTFTYWHPIQRGDIVGANTLKDGDPVSLIKRVIGLPGDRIVITKGNVYVNGVLIQEPYLTESNKYTEGEIDKVLSDDEYFLMGDNRKYSLDSRSDRIKSITYKDIIGVLIKVEVN